MHKIWYDSENTGSESRYPVGSVMTGVPKLPTTQLVISTTWHVMKTECQVCCYVIFVSTEKLQAFQTHI